MPEQRLSQRPTFTRHKTLSVSTLRPRHSIPTRISGTQQEVAELYNNLVTAPQVPGPQLSIRPGAYGVYHGQLQLAPDAPAVAANWGWEIDQVGGSGREPDITYSLFLENGSRAVDNWLDMIFGACFDISDGVRDELETPTGKVRCVKVSRRATHFGGTNRLMWYDATQSILVKLVVDSPPIPGRRWSLYSCTLRESTGIFSDITSDVGQRTRIVDEGRPVHDTRRVSTSATARNTSDPAQGVDSQQPPQHTGSHLLNIPRPTADADFAAEWNIRYQRERLDRLNKWRALPWWRRLFTPRP